MIKTVETALSKCADIGGEFPTITNLNEEKRFIKKLLIAGLVRQISKKSNSGCFLGFKKINAAVSIRIQKWQGCFQENKLIISL